MTFSDALPVQFWPASQETYNEKTPQGVFRKCFCQPWQCNDEIKVQFLQAHTTPDSDYFLVVTDSDDEILTTIPFTEAVEGVESASFIPEDEGICDEQIQLYVLDENAVAVLPPNEWSDDDVLAFGALDTKTNTTFAESVSTTTGFIGAFQEAAVPVGTLITIPITVDITGTWTGTINIVMYLTDANGNIRSTDTTTDTTDLEANGTHTISFKLTGATATSVRLYLQLTESLASGTASVTITLPVNTVLYFSEDAILRKSDCLDVKVSQPETTLISYSNDRNFASLNYSLVTPDPTFYIRIPSSFFHERFPEESEVIELSNSRSIQLNAQVKAQRKLEIGPMPYYMHRKLKLILKHQFVEIDDQEWVQSEVYELIEGNRRSALKQAAVWLDEKDWIQRNVL